VTKNQNSKENFPGHFISKQFIFTSIFYGLKLDLHYMINILYRFPKDKVRRKQWMQNIHREKWSPQKQTLICSDHFKESYIDRTGNLVRINQDAVPTRFKMFPDHLKKACYYYNIIKPQSFPIDK
jgi:hypothetical protein